MREGNGADHILLLEADVLGEAGVYEVGVSGARKVVMWISRKMNWRMLK
jgi:hypothetical protein